jgi:CRISPR-associated protein Cas2
MYVILVYDFGEKRVGKMLKLCRKYLNWIQNSVFEGEISEVKLKELTIKAKTIMNERRKTASSYFSNHTGYYMNKQVVGKERMKLDNFL